MSKMADATQEFLENGGYSLGYSYTTMPIVRDLQVVLDNGIWIWEYNGLTEEEYYNAE